jgi:cell division ATPase FtsA
MLFHKSLELIVLKGIKNPIGMCGSRLEAHVHIVTGKTPLIQNLVKCVEHLELHAMMSLFNQLLHQDQFLTD